MSVHAKIVSKIENIKYINIKYKIYKNLKYNVYVCVCFSLQADEYLFFILK